MSGAFVFAFSPPAGEAMVDLILMMQRVDGNEYLRMEKITC